MNPERERQIMRVLESAQELEASERRAFLDRACAGDQALRREVESLLVAHDRAGNFMAGLALKDAAKMFAEAETWPAHSNAAGDPYATTTPSAQAVPLAPGVLVGGRYLIERELGRGGFGAVYLAKDQNVHGKPVVLKVLLERRMVDDERHWFEQKFRDEIAALARINHPGVVPATDSGQLPDGRPYLVMGYVPGEPLRKFIPPAGMELQRAAGLLQQLALALAAAHEQGVIHRDLKPENILLHTVDGAEQIKLIDFGIATVRAAMTAGLPIAATRAAGTKEYMAPEQLRGQPEEASDIYALGVIAYELVTGRRPFNAASLAHLAELQHKGIEVKPRELRGDLPEAAQEVILRALAFEPANRQRKARAFADELKLALEPDPFKTSSGELLPEDVPLPPESAPDSHRPAARRRFLIPLAALLAIMLAGGLDWRSLDFAHRNVPSLTPAAPTSGLPVAAAHTLS